MSTSPLITAAALHVLLAQHPELAATPIRWEIGPDGTLTASPPHSAAGGIDAIRALAAAVGAEVRERNIRPGSPDAIRWVHIDYGTTFAGAELRGGAYEPMPLPVREVHTAAEAELGEAWVDRYGPRAAWPQDVRLAYAATVAQLRAGGAL